MADDVAISKFLSLVLRHQPEAAGLTLDGGGWTEIDALVAAAPLIASREDVLRVAQGSDKRRFAISPDGHRVRAVQGHSIEVDLGLVPTEPPEILFHGTATRALDPIRAEGLRPMARRHVHLSADAATATEVGRRYGRPAVLHVRAGAMAAAGHVFWQAENGVWLTDAVPSEFIAFPDP